MKAPTKSVLGTLNTVASLAYSMRLKKGTWLGLEGKQVQFQLNIDNLLNKQAVIYQDDTVVPRPADGNFATLNRVSIPAKNAIYQQPVSAIFTMRLKM